MPYVLIQRRHGDVTLPPIYFESLEDAQAKFDELNNIDVGMDVYWLYKNGEPGQPILWNYKKEDE